MRFRTRAELVPSLLLLITLAVRPGKALSFTTWNLKSGKTVLFVHDCGKLPADKDSIKLDGTKGCDVWETMVSGPQFDRETQLYPGDAKVLDRLLSAREQAGKPYSEVWLFSWGGNLGEGIASAKVLRLHHATVRVPDGAECISSCTVIFMGGYFRYVETGASYRVHSGSMVSEGTADAPDKSWASTLIVEARNDPDKAFSDFAIFEQIEERKLARILERLFQNTLLIPFRMALPDVDADFAEWAKSNPPHLAYTDPGVPQRAADVRRYKVEGPACIQDIAMRIERDAMAQAISEVRDILPSLGKRAEPALSMVSAMYMTSIKETSDLSQETMLKMGYTTDDVVLQ